MSDPKSQIGARSGLFRDEATAHRISAFCRAIGSQSEAVAPPTYLTVLREGEFSLFQKLGYELSQVLHAGQEYQYESPIFAGDRVSYETVVSNILEKKKETAFTRFLTFETEYFAERGNDHIRVGKSKTTIVVRGQM